MDERTQGLILRIRPLSDTSLIVHWLTAEHGRLATVAKGARRPKSPFLGRLDLFELCDFSFRRARSGDLHALGEIASVEHFPAIRADYGLLCQAAYASAFLEQMTEPETPLEELYELLIGWLRHIASGAPRPRNVYAFELHMLECLGLGPDWSDVDSEAASLAGTLANGAWDTVDALAPSPAAVNTVRRRLHGFIIHHCSRLPKGRAEALAAGVP
jgi:DNA repair protein RecO (recombination protein O)